MHLYQLTLQRSNAINCAVQGNFSSPQEHEMVVSHGKAIELLRPDASGKLLSVCHMECFGHIRSMAAVRLPGANTDCLALGSDSGRLALVHYIPVHFFFSLPPCFRVVEQHNRFSANVLVLTVRRCVSMHKQERDQFERIHLETYGRSGCRRTVAGQYMAADPAGRALMIAAIEKQRVIYTFDRDSNSLVSISAPIEAPRPGAITFSIAALDTGKGNPLFACLELEYAAATPDGGADGDGPHKILSMYEVDVSSKPAQVLKKTSEAIDPASNLVIAVPGGTQGPGGVLVCDKNKWAYVGGGGGGDEIVTLIPRRTGMPISQPLLITTYTLLQQGANTSLLLQVCLCGCVCGSVDIAVCVVCIFGPFRVEIPHTHIHIHTLRILSLSFSRTLTHTHKHTRTHT